MSAVKTSTPPIGLRSKVITLVAGGATVAYAMLVFVPAQQAIAQRRAAVKASQRQITSKESLSAPIKDVEDKLATTESFIAAWRATAPDNRDMSALFAQVISDANQAGAEVMSFTPQAEQPLETIGLVPVALQIEGSYHSLHEFLQKLEGRTGVIWTDELRFLPHEGDPERIQCTLKLVIFVDHNEISD